MTTGEYLKKISEFNLSEEHVIQVLTMPLLLVGAGDKRLSLQEVRVLDIYENQLSEIMGLIKVDDPPGFFEKVREKFEDNPFGNVNEVTKLIHYNMKSLGGEKKLKLKNILASGMYMLASSAKDRPEDKNYVSDSEMAMIRELVKALELDHLEYGRRLLNLKASDR